MAPPSAQLCGLARDLWQALGDLAGPAQTASEADVLALRRYLGELGLRGGTTEAFDPKGLEAQRMLLDIWAAAFPADPLECAADGPHWKKLGFQSDTPHTDVRNGRLGLDQLHYLALSQPEKFRRLVAEAQEMDYPFACSCFNVTQLLVIFFGLSTGMCLSPVRGATRGSSGQLRNFAELCAATQWRGQRVVLDELFCALVEGLHETWKDMRRSGPVTLMDFPRALSGVHAAHTAFWRLKHKDVSDFEELRGRLGHREPGGVAGVVSLLRALVAAAMEVGQQALLQSLALLGDEGAPDTDADAGRRGSYQPPVLPAPDGRVPYTSFVDAVPRRKPAGPVDVDAVLSSLGLFDHDAPSEPTRAGSHPGSPPEPSADARDLDAFLDRCLSGAPPAGSSREGGTAARLWEDFGEW